MAADAFVGQKEKGLFGKSSASKPELSGVTLCRGNPPTHAHTCMSLWKISDAPNDGLRFSSRAPIQMIKEQSAFCRDPHPKCNFQNGN